MSAVWPGVQVEEVNLAHNISDLRRILGSGAIETVPKHGYRFAIEVRRLERPTPSTPSAWAGWRKWALIGVTAAVVLAGLYFSAWRHAPPAPEIRSLAVLPFHEIDRPGSEPTLELGLADVLINRLGSIGGTAVRPIGAVRRFAAVDQDPLDAGRKLKVDAVIEGGIHRLDQSVRITVRLLSVRDGATIWSGAVDAPAGQSAILLEDALSERVLAALRPRLTARQRQRFAETMTTDPRAFHLYLEGRYFFGRRTSPDVRKAAEFFEEAIAADPRYALAYVGLAEAQVFSGAPTGQVRSNLDRALQLDPELAEPHALMGLLAMNREFDWNKAEREYRRALQLDANLAVAHQWYGDFLGYMGRFQESAAELDQAITLDPLSPIVWTDRCEMLALASQFPEAIAACRYVLEMQPDYSRAHVQLAQAYLLNRQPREALESAQAGFRLDGDSLVALARLAECYAATGDRVQSRAVLAKLEARGNEGGEPLESAAVYLLLGEREKALGALEKSYAIHWGSLIDIKMNPVFDGLRSEPRFRALLERLHMQ